MFATAYSKKQSLQKAGEELVNLNIEKLKEKKKVDPGMTLGMAPAPTLTLRGLIKNTSYLISPK